jgi:hypothetical protein
MLELVYRKVIEDGLEENADNEDGLEENADDGSISLPDYDYLWHGSVGGDGAICGAECTVEYGTIQPPDEDQIRRIVAEVRERLAKD